MLRSTLARLRCPMPNNGDVCGGQVRVKSQDSGFEITSGELYCSSCTASFPILCGVAVVVPDVEGYLLHHVKGISKVVPDASIPAAIRNEFSELRKTLEEEHIEEDLESERVNALYLMNHYFKVQGADRPWWKSKAESESPLISDLIEKHWDHGPFEVVSNWIQKDARVIELGCGVGGFYRKLQAKNITYLGVDSSFLSILIARHIHLGTAYPGELRFPGDLLYGNLAQIAEIQIAGLSIDSRVDFIVGEIDAVPVEQNGFDVCVSMNAIDMLDDPKRLPEVQKSLVRFGGEVIQTGPYIWHERIARGLRGRAPKKCDSSAAVVEWLYEKAGLKLEARELHVPWLFFKHLRQLEVYSVHAFLARKS